MIDYPAVSGKLIHKGAVLEIKRRNPPLQGQWCFPGGKIELFETPEQALLREFKEEVGLEIRVGRLYDEITQPFNDQYRYHIYCFECTLIYTHQRPTAGSDALSYRWRRL